MLSSRCCSSVSVIFHPAETTMALITAVICYRLSVTAWLLLHRIYTVEYTRRSRQQLLFGSLHLCCCLTVRDVDPVVTITATIDYSLICLLNITWWHCVKYSLSDIKDGGNDVTFLGNWQSCGNVLLFVFYFDDPAENVNRLTAWLHYIFIQYTSWASWPVCQNDSDIDDHNNSVNRPSLDVTRR